jgi:hypothetical protein
MGDYVKVDLKEMLYQGSDEERNTSGLVVNLTMNHRPVK